jgi:hypothetical protein
MKPSPSEVDVAPGKVRAFKNVRPSKKGRRLRPLLPATAVAKKILTPLQALESLQARLRLTPLQARHWAAAARAARR